MSYYMGDYYRGDPGIGSFFKGLVSKAVSFIPGVGPIASSVINALPGGAKPAAAAITAAASGGTLAARAGSIVRAGGAMVLKHPVATAAAGAGAAAVLGAGAERMLSMGGGAAHGKHVLKRCGTMTKAGRPAKCHRSMNVCNPRALRRAIRRTRGFAKLAMRTIHIVHPKKKGRFGGFKRRKRA